ncbi:MAG: hypothetical protein P1U87_19865 [Verrucomicrobiales bacterium]|nr:hypothetical protein [Verrucomicrobiales bacterium]
MSISFPIKENQGSISSAESGVVSHLDDLFSFYAEIAATYGTPFYLYDAAKIEEQVLSLRSLLPTENSDILFSFKSNPNPSVTGQMKIHGCRADLTSPGEIEAAQVAGFDLSKALYGGPGKSEGELIGAILAGIRSFSMESVHDLKALSGAAASVGESVKALLRINPQEAPKAKLAMSGVASQFGFEEEDLRSDGEEIMASAGPGVDLVGIHIYWGTQVGDAEALLDCFRRTVKIAEEISNDLRFPLEILNLGGGFPWPYSTIGVGPDLSPLTAGLEELFEESSAAKNAEWWFESGRFLCASSGTLVTRVMEVKTSKEKQFLILDTGIHHLGGMSGLGRIPRFSIDLEVPPSRANNEKIQVEVVGQLCTPLDCIGRRIKLPQVEPGDLVSVPNTGAYGPTASVLGFLSRPTPAEILHRDGEILSANRLRSGHETLEQRKSHHTHESH